MNAKNSQFKNGHEYEFMPNKNSSPVYLTYVGPLKNGMHRFFSTEYPSLDYHLHGSVDIVEIAFSGTEPSEFYISFAGNDAEKKKAYLSLLERAHKT